MKRLWILPLALLVPVWAMFSANAGATVTYRVQNATQIYGTISGADNTATDFSCGHSGKAAASINDGVSSGTWNSGHAYIQYDDPNVGWLDVSSDADYTDNSLLITFDTVAGIPIRIKTSTSGMKLGFWIICGN